MKCSKRSMVRLCINYLKNEAHLALWSSEGKTDWMVPHWTEAESFRSGNQRPFQEIYCPTDNGHCRRAARNSGYTNRRLLCCRRDQRCQFIISSIDTKRYSSDYKLRTAPKRAKHSSIVHLQLKPKKLKKSVSSISYETSRTPQQPLSPLALANNYLLSAVCNRVSATYKNTLPMSRQELCL